ncbi:DUF91 domain-containing protein [Gloeocapsopsis crepidinum LEGE 06123]|uniref:DUF91 domain-containing protein n=1 Tax=Gloeocapsopsis crepidinum LEGE 06123 TaxID=588587 RepID=A0ABR9UQE5_9CHRO|nr:endonuclease NucS domain-containing protein [Gloeocapsopsis crepidinum]MBE9190479.1 DUF91 domain-containing protein [Gloeocapsopsis crepidinum LEGE 06123]
MLKKVDGSWRFASENNLEDFTWSKLNNLFRLSPLKRQYRVYGDVCDILALDENDRLVIIELKNAQDRYIVQQLTRYYHSVLEEKPLQQHINYQLPIRMIAIAPSFHYHSWVDREYHKLKFEFISYTLIQQQNDDIYIQLTDLDTKKVATEKVTNLSSVKKVNLSQPYDMATTEIGGFTFTKALDDILSDYVLVKNAHKLGIPELELSEIERLNNQGYPSKVSKVFKIRVEENRAKNGYREVSIRVPSSIRVGTFVIWVDKRISTAVGVISPTNGKYHIYRSK